MDRRIIPARAGFTPAERNEIVDAEDHPRSRGVYGEVVGNAVVGVGSSPLARGLRDHDLHGRFDPGIIPARAGFTGRGEDPHRPPGDHPRSRGVYGPIGEGDLLLAGIIPARAGFTARAGAIARGRRDHPRSRGVYR